MEQIRDKKIVNDRRLGWFFLALFAIFIITGIVIKRVFNHPEMIMFFHLPAAFFLVMAGQRLPTTLRKRYQTDCSKIRNIQMSHDGNANLKNK